jgi:Tfp pilus assembly protein PilF
MKTFKIFSLLLLASASMNAQDVDQASKAIDAEQYEKAKSILKGILNTTPTNGKASFLLGNVYLRQSVEDSAKIYFQKGLAAKEGANLNNIGLGQIDLDNNNITEAKAYFTLATATMKKKSIEEYIFIARAYMNASTPDYKAAIEVLNRAKAINPNDAQLQLALGDAFYGDKNQNEAYVAYRAAYGTDSSLIRAKMQSGVLLKGARAFNEAVKAYDEVIALNPNYGPVYRELAETYYLWANTDGKKYTENIQKSLGFYEKYMSLTDYSLSSRMRHADFLILAKDYKALEIEANKMKELDKVNPRILRYLGYAAFENGNIDAAITALTDFTTKSTNKIIARDYFYLAQAKTKKAQGPDGLIVDQAAFADVLSNYKKAIELDEKIANELNAIGKAYFTKKQYKEAASVFELAIATTTSKNFLEDNIYYGLCVYTENRNKKAEELDKEAMIKADKSLDVVIAATPSYLESYLYKARINNTLENDEVAQITYQKFIDLVIVKTPEEIATNKTKLIEAYNNIAAIYANTDKPKAVEYFTKTLELDPANKYALDSVKVLKQK